MNLYEEILRLRKEGRPSCLATIVQCVGSSPQKEGAKMLIRDDGSIVGSLGGGCLEAEVIQHGMMAIEDGIPRTIPFQLTERHGGLVCGGKVLIYIDPVIPEPTLVILGAGHVGKALSTVARFSGFRVIVADDRADYANRENIPDAHEIIVNDFSSIFSHVHVDKSAYVVIATRGHNHDMEAVKAALLTEARYVGLMGSKRKKALLSKALAEEGFSEEDICRVIIPVGLAIGSVTAEEISISIIAQIIQQRREHAATGNSRSSCSGFGSEDGTVEAAPPCR